MQPVQVAHPGRQGVERRLNLLVGIIEKRGEHERGCLASYLGMIEPAFLAESEQRGCRRPDKYDGFIPFLGKSRQKIRFARGNEPGYPKLFFVFSQGIEKALELFRLIYKIEGHKTPIIQDELADKRNRDNYCTIGKMPEKKKKDFPSNRFELTFYSGYKGKETPRSVIIGGREFKIDSILERKRVLDERTEKSCEVFTCTIEGQRARLVIHESGEFEIVYL